MIAGEDDAGDLLLGVPLGDQIAPQDFQPAVALPDLFPQIGRAMPVGVHRVALAAVVALVERQKPRRGTGQPGGHGHLAVADREVHQRAPGEAQQGLRLAALGVGMAVETILVDGVADGLGEVGLQLRRRDRDAVQIQHQVQAVLIGGRVSHLAHHAQAVGLISPRDLRVHAHGRTELGHGDLGLHPRDLYAGAQDLQRPPVVQVLAQPVGQHGFRSGPVGLR
ncbi:hypothetical protein D3C72_426280 [compost metagenome]